MQSSVTVGATDQPEVGGGFATGSVSYSTATPTVCYVSATGLIFGKSAGNFLVDSGLNRQKVEPNARIAQRCPCEIYER